MTNTQYENWLLMWQQYMDFMKENGRRPSKYDLKERKLVNWCRHNQKLRNQEKLTGERLEKMNLLLDEVVKYQRINQYAYTSSALPELQAAAEAAKSTRMFYRRTRTVKPRWSKPKDLKK